MPTDPHTWAAYAVLSCAAMSTKITEKGEDGPDNSQRKNQEKKPAWLSRALRLLLRRRAQKKQQT